MSPASRDRSIARPGFTGEGIGFLVQGPHLDGGSEVLPEQRPMTFAFAATDEAKV